MKKSRMFLLVLFFFISTEMTFAFSLCGEGENNKFSEKNTPHEIGAILAERIQEKFGIVKDEGVNNKVKEVFSRIIAVVEKGKEVSFNIEILDTPLIDACALPGGFIFLSKGMVDLTTTPDELAVIIAHEIAHEVRGHTENPYENRMGVLFKEKSLRQRSFLQEVAGILSKEDEKIKEVVESMRLEKEREADKFGLLYAHFANFEAVPAMNNVLDKLMRNRLKEIPATVEERRSVIQKMVGDIAAQIEVFEAGVSLYQAGKFDLAGIAFSNFLKVYPGKEVYYNLGVTYYQLSLQNKDFPDNPPFFCSLDLEKNTRASKFTSVGKSKMTDDYMETAYTYLKKALEFDPNNINANLALSCVYIINDKPIFALAHLKEIEGKGAKEVEILNNFGIVYTKLNDLRQAGENFQKAINKDAGFAPPYFNVALIKAGNNDHKVYLKKFLTLKSLPPVYVRMARKMIGEASESLAASYSSPIAGIKEGMSMESVEKILGPAAKTVNIKPLSFEISVYGEKNMRILNEGGYVIHVYKKN